jgi:hypothetical protein
MTREALAGDLPPGSASFRPGAIADPQQRVVAGVVTAASSVLGLMPGPPCNIVFSWDYIGVHTASGETDRIPYSEVNSLDVSGQGTRVFTRNAGIIGGGFGVTGALEGMALAHLANAATTRTTTIRDTVVNFRAGQRAILMQSETFEPDALRIILSPVYHRIERAARAGALPATSGSTPAGWYSDPAGSSSKRYWDGSRWTEHFAP